MKLWRLMLCGAMALAITAPLHADNSAPPVRDAEKEKAIRQLLQIMGMSKLSQQMMNQMIASLKSSDAQIPEAFWTKFQKKTKSDDLVEKIIPIYDKYYSREEVKGLIVFYKSPLGQKVLSTLPQITQESMEAGQEWGRKKAEEVIEDLKKEQPPQNQ